MEKKLVILEDHADWALHYISQLRESHKISTLLLYFDNAKKEISLTDEVRERFGELTVEVQHVDMYNLLSTLEGLYKEKDNVFLFDVDLEGDRNPLLYKLHIAFALQKIRSNEAALERFFCYSTFPTAEQSAALNFYFKGHVINCKRQLVSIDGNSGKTIYTVLEYKKNKDFCSVFELNT